MAVGENAGGEPANALSDFLAKTHRMLAADDSGAVADYIPELLKADPKHFGIALATTEATFTRSAMQRSPLQSSPSPRPSYFRWRWKFSVPIVSRP